MENEFWARRKARKIHAIFFLFQFFSCKTRRKRILDKFLTNIKAQKKKDFRVKRRIKSHEQRCGGEGQTVMSRGFSNYSRVHAIKFSPLKKIINFSWKFSFVYFFFTKNCLFSLTLVAHTKTARDVFFCVFFRGKIIVRKWQMRKLSWNAKVIVYWLSDLKTSLKSNSSGRLIAFIEHNDLKRPSTPSAHEDQEFYHRN